MPNPAPQPVALVTGASTGIGYAFALLLASKGHDLILTARSRSRLEDAAEKIGAASSGVKCTLIPVDLGAHGGVDELAAAISAANLPVDVLINNAGFGLKGEFGKQDPAQLAEMIELNVMALTRLTRVYLPPMIARRSGWILNVASTAAFQPGPLMAVYFATKAYVLSFSEAIANEARPSGVKVTCLCPGATATPFVDRAGMADSKLFEKSAMSAAEVARIGYEALMAGKSTVVAGPGNALMALSTRLAPRAMAASIARRMMEKM